MEKDKKFDKKLSANEKKLVMSSIFENKSRNRIMNVGDFISNNFSKIDGFDFRWTSLISNNPLLFEDIDYLRVRDFIDNRITDEEKQAYIDGKLTDIYATFENMLVCNLKYYDRIMSFCTMVFLRYVRIDGNIVYIDDKKNSKRIPHYISITPTKLLCSALSDTKSTPWELNYAWNFEGKNIVTRLPKPNTDESALELNWKNIYRNKVFKYFVEYASVRIGTTGFRHTLFMDKTSNRKLAQVCSKFTKTSVAISEQQLDTLYKYSLDVESVKNKLYTVLDYCMSTLFNGDQTQYSIYVFESEYYIFSVKFSMRVTKDAKGKISKEYLANSYECFAAEEFLIPSIKTQIEWARNTQARHFEYDKNILKTLLNNMLDNNFREIICINKMNDFGVVSKITFKGVFNNVSIVEEFMLNNRTIKSETKTFSKRNAANYIVNRGYYIFGIEEDVFKLNAEEKITKKLLVNHYSNYCIPVLTYMFDVISTHIMSKNDIIDFVVSDKVNPNKFNNHNIKYTSVSKLDHKTILSEKMKEKSLSKKSYWKIIDE